MSKPVEFEYINMGMFTGMYMLVELMQNGWSPSDKGLEALRQMCATNIEKTSGMPAEDYALLMQPGIDVLIKHIEEMNA